MLGSNDIKHIPDEIAALSELVELDLSYNTALNHLPDSMGQLKKLEKLYLNGMHDILLNGISYDDFEEDTAHLLPTFPNCIRQMTRLKHFYLDDAWIKSIPTWTKELTQLETLSFKTGDGGTPYLRIPDTITQLVHLKQLEFNGFTIEIPSSINQLQSLTHLTATGAFFIPDSLKYLKNLTYLDLSFFDSSLDFKIKGFNTAEDLYDKSIPENSSRLDLYGWQWLKEMTWLKQFKFHHIEPFAFSAVEIAELQQALPYCKLDIEER